MTEEWDDIYIYLSDRLARDARQQWGDTEWTFSSSMERCLF